MNELPLHQTSPNSQAATAGEAATASGERPLRADAKRNRDLLIAAAEDMFLEHGADASLEEIARRAGVGIGTLYRHFPTRDDLIAQVVYDHTTAIIERARELLHAPSALLALTRWLEALVEHSATFNGLTRALAAGYAGATSQRLCTACDEIVSAGTPLILRAQDVGDIRSDVTPADVIASANAAAWIAEQTGELEAATRHLQLVLDGLRASAQARKPAPKAKPAEAKPAAAKAPKPRAKRSR